jgi:hypothetical protein
LDPGRLICWGLLDEHAGSAECSLLHRPGDGDTRDLIAIRISYVDRIAVPIAFLCQFVRHPRAVSDRLFSGRKSPAFSGKKSPTFILKNIAVPDMKVVPPSARGSATSRVAPNSPKVDGHRTRRIPSNAPRSF